MPSAPTAPRIDARGVVLSCPGCGRSNRITFPTLTRTVRCPHCRTTLPAPSTPLEIDSTATFDAAVASSALPLIVDFWAPWCGPCRAVAPELERVARNQAGQYLVVKVNTDALEDVAARFRIQSIPTLAVIAGGREIARTSGVRPAEDIETFARQALSAHQARAS